MPKSPCARVPDLPQARRGHDARLLPLQLLKTQNSKLRTAVTVRFTRYDSPIFSRPRQAGATANVGPVIHPFSWSFRSLTRLHCYSIMPAVWHDSGRLQMIASALPIALPRDHGFFCELFSATFLPFSHCSSDPIVPSGPAFKAATRRRIQQTYANCNPRSARSALPDSHNGLHGPAPRSLAEPPAHSSVHASEISLKGGDERGIDEYSTHVAAA